MNDDWLGESIDAGADTVTMLGSVFTVVASATLTVGTGFKALVDERTNVVMAQFPVTFDINGTSVGRLGVLSTGADAVPTALRINDRVKDSATNVVWLIQQIRDDRFGGGRLQGRTALVSAAPM